MGTISKKQVIHSIIGVCIMIFFQFLPINLPEVTDMGLRVLGIFIGTIYLWVTVDLIWSSLLSLCLLVFCGYFTMNDMLTSFLGNAVIMLLMWAMLMANTLSKYGITPYLARFCLTIKLVRGRPFMFAFVMGVVIYLLGAFVTPIAAIFLFWPILTEAFKSVGYKKGDVFPKLMTIYVVICALLGFPVAPYMANAQILIGNFAGMVKDTDVVFMVNNPKYLAFELIIGFVIMIILVLVMKFVIRPDVAPFKQMDYTTFDENPLPKLTVQQRVLVVGFVAMMLIMLFPSVIPGAPGMPYLATLTNGIPLVTAAILCAIPVKGKATISIQELLSENFGWGTIFMCCAAVILGNALTSDVTGIGACIASVVGPFLNSMGPAAFMIVFCILVCVLTNVLNSLIVGLIFEPIVLAYCMTTGMNPVPVIVLLITVTLGTAIVTPAGSPFAAVLHANKTWTDSGDIYKYATLFVVVEMVIICAIGIPFITSIM